MKPYGIYFGGKSYPLMRHGFARHSEFTLVEKGEDFVVLELRENETTLEQYPSPSPSASATNLQTRAFIRSTR